MPNLYCQACNQVFSADDEGCPRCGMTAVRAHASSMDTVIFSDEEAEATATDLHLDEQLLDGQIVDIYHCERVLGRGGMGIVYLARHRRLNRQCALKVLSPRNFLIDNDYVGRFENEGRAAAALVHPNIVTTHAIGKSGNHHFLEMELVPGESLQQELERNGVLGPLRALQMAVGIAEGLAAAHRLGIVHRDLKPDNVLVTPAGYPKIADFGLAKQVRPGGGMDAHVAGTPHFMAPEVFRGDPATPASDVFALGVCLYVMLTGKYPFEGNSINGLAAATMAGEYEGLRSLNADIPMDVAECVGLMLSSNPNTRPRNGMAASQLLQAVLGATRDLDTLAYEAFHGLRGVEYESVDGVIEVTLQVPVDRTQKVFVANSNHRAGDRLLNIYSVCCAADPDFYEDALRLNSIVLHGGIAIRDVDNVPSFVMVDTFPRATVTAEEIRRSVVEIGTRADAIEEMLTDGDIN